MACNCVRWRDGVQRRAAACNYATACDGAISFRRGDGVQWGNGVRRGNGVRCAMVCDGEQATAPSPEPETVMEGYAATNNKYPGGSGKIQRDMACNIESQ